MDCIFCKIVSRQIQSKIIQESPHSIAFLDAFPLVKGHTLVIPKNHHVKIQDMSAEENSDLFSLKYNDPVIKNELIKRTDESFAKGVFGVPTFIVNGKLFWGQDRLEFVLSEAKK